MAYQSIWYFTDLNSEIVKTIEKDLEQNYGDAMKESEIDSGKVEKWKRNSKNAWVPTSHWLGGFMWHYVQRANRENFLYDLRNITVKRCNTPDMVKVSFMDGIVILTCIAITSLHQKECSAIRRK